MRKILVRIAYAKQMIREPEQGLIKLRMKQPFTRTTCIFRQAGCQGGVKKDSLPEPGPNRPGCTDGENQSMDIILVD